MIVLQIDATCEPICKDKYHYKPLSESSYFEETDCGIMEENEIKDGV